MHKELQLFLFSTYLKLYLGTSVEVSTEHCSMS